MRDVSRDAALVDADVDDRRCPAASPRQGSRGISFGDSVPGSSTPPMTRSASATRGGERVVAELGERARRDAGPSAAIAAAARPRPRGAAREHASRAQPSAPRRAPPRRLTLPAPITTTAAPGTSSTPVSSTPAPPRSVASASAPAKGASRPAMRDIGASSGTPPCASRTVSYADHRDARREHRREQRRIAVELREAEDGRPGRRGSGYSGGCSSFTLTTRSHDQTGPVRRRSSRRRRDTRRRRSRRPRPRPARRRRRDPRREARATPSGVRPTRRSPSLISRGTPMRIEDILARPPALVCWHP